jgi:AcrR family transcriptional regulator
MAQPARPLRADAARNRARVLETAYETFAAEGLSVPIDDIARRAGVGAGTIYRHFPTKEDLFRAVVESRLRRIIAEGRALLDEPGPGEALFAFLRSMVLDWGATDQGLVDALAGLGIDVESIAPDAEDAFLGLLGELLAAAQRAGAVRPDVDVPEIKALMVGCQAMQGYDQARAERVTGVVIDGLRPSS